MILCKKGTKKGTGGKGVKKTCEKLHFKTMIQTHQQNDYFHQY